MFQTDVLIVGGGPAGLASAIAARRQGLRVALVDCRKPPIDKACGEGLLPAGAAALQALGVNLDSTLAVPFRGLRFSDNRSSVSARFPRGAAFGVRRTTLHTLLVDRASAAGVSFLWGARVSEFSSTGAKVDGEWIRCNWLVGADGRQSAVRRFAKLRHRLRGPARFGFRRHYAIAPWTGFVDVYWGERCQIVVTPTGADEICVSVFAGDPRVRLDRAIAGFPELADRLRDARAVSVQAGAVTSLGRARGVVRGNVALVGDASGTVDGIAGQGLSLAFQQALALGTALGRGDLSLYEFEHRRIMRNAARITRLLLLMSASSFVRRKVFRSFAAHPAFFASLISVHADPASSEVFGASDILNLGWRVLCA